MAMAAAWPKLKGLPGVPSFQLKHHLVEGDASGER